jgi:DNA-binding MarR family transcriptional regulator
MQAIHDAGRISPGDVARRIHLSPGTVTGILNRLDQRGLVQRGPSPVDRRRLEILLTAQGSEALERAPSPLQDRLRRELARLADWEQTTLLAALQRIASMMDAAELDAAPHLVTSELDTAGPEGPPAAEATAPAPDPTLTELLRAGWSLASADRTARDDA